MNDTELAELVSTWQYGYCLLEINDRYSLDVVVTFDHDYEFHILTKEWDIKYPGHFPIYSLWFIGQGNTCLVKRWILKDKDKHAPFVEAAEIVSDWKNMCAKYSEMRYRNEI